MIGRLPVFRIAAIWSSKVFIDAILRRVRRASRVEHRVRSRRTTMSRRSVLTPGQQASTRIDRPYRLVIVI
jgi:hypothetical protein